LIKRQATKYKDQFQLQVIPTISYSYLSSEMNL
jgi:hypothetical protein